MASNTNPATVLVEKHYIPVSIYRELYSQSTTSSPVQSAQVHPTASSTFNRVFNNFFPRTQQQQESAQNTQPEDTYADLMSFFSTPATNTRRVSVNNSHDEEPTRPTNRNTSRFTRRTETRSGPNGTPIIFETATGSIPMNGTSTDAISMLLSTFLNVTAPGTDTPARLTQTQLSANSRVFTYSNSVDLDTTECPICTAEWTDGEEIRKLNMCRHYFHRTCIDRWLEEHNNCPLCRVNVMPPDINEVD